MTLACVVGILEGHLHYKAVLSITTYCQLISSPRWQPSPQPWASTPRSLQQWPRPQLTRVRDTCSTPLIPCQPMFTPFYSPRPSPLGPTPHRSPPSTAASILQGASTPRILSAQPKADHINILRNIHRSYLSDVHGAILWWLAFLNHKNHTPMYFGCDYW